MFSSSSTTAERHEQIVHGSVHARGCLRPGVGHRVVHSRGYSSRGRHIVAHGGECFAGVFGQQQEGGLSLSTWNHLENFSAMLCHALDSHVQKLLNLRPFE